MVLLKCSSYLPNTLTVQSGENLGIKYITEIWATNNYLSMLLILPSKHCKML